MRALARLISRRNEMPEQRDDLTRLRKAHYSLEDLPDTISFPAHPGSEAEAPAALEAERLRTSAAAQPATISE